MCHSYYVHHTEMTQISKYQPIYVYLLFLQLVNVLWTYWLIP